MKKDKKESFFIIEKSSHDYYGRQHVTVTINEESVEIPFSVIEDFVKNEKIIRQYVPIRYEY